MTKEQFILSTIRPMAEYTFPFITSVVGINEVTQGGAPRVGVACDRQRPARRHLRRHVIEQAATYPLKFALSAGYGAAPYVVSGKIELDPVGDLAVYYLLDDFPFDAPGVAFWPEDRIQRSTERLASDFLFTHGFPGARARFSPLAQGLMNRSLPYGAMQRLDPPVAGLEPHQFAIEFDPSGMRAIDVPAGDTFVDPRAQREPGVADRDQRPLAGGVVAGPQPRRGVPHPVASGRQGPRRDVRPAPVRDPEPRLTRPRPPRAFCCALRRG